MDYILFPGRHHLLTTYQERYLQGLQAGGMDDIDQNALPDLDRATVIFAVTSWDRSGTRLNPLPGHRREAAIELFGRDAGLDVLVVPVPHVAPTTRFVDVIENAVSVHTGSNIELSPDNTVVACSSPAVIDLFVDAGYRIAPVEMAGGHDQQLAAARPWTHVEDLARDQNLDALRDQVHGASHDILSRYDWVATMAELFADPLLGDQGDLTETRDYVTYADSFDDGADRKYDLVRDLVRPGRIVDIGCGTGALLHKLADAPELDESDLFGVEAARPLYEMCEHRRTMGWFDNPNTFFFHRNVLNTPVFRSASVDTTITMALTHEVYSYLSHESVITMVDRIAAHTRPGGVWVNADVCGPDNPDDIVEFDLRTGDGLPNTDKTPTPELTDSDSYLGALSTWGRWTRFVEDFRAVEGELVKWERVGQGTARASKRVLYEFLSKKDYTQNWLSEMHEVFCRYTFADWADIATEAGFVVGPGSRPYRNDWIVENRWRPVCTIRTLAGKPQDFETSHLILAAVKATIS